MALPDTVQRRREGFDVDALLTDSEGQTITATGNSTTPLQVGAGAEFEVSVKAATIAGTTPTMDITIQGATDLAFSSPVPIVTLAQLDDSVDPAELQVAFKSDYEYVRAAWVVAGAGATFDTTIALRS